MSADNEVTVFDAVIKTPFCYLGLVLEDNELAGTEYLSADTKPFNSSNPEIAAIVKQIQAYAEDSSLIFRLPVKTRGTEFQRRVWKKLTEIPPGKVKTYGELAKELVSSAQAVGNACRANPIPLIIPCHRVVSASGIGGFAGTTSGYLIDIKRQLLRHEGLEF